MWRTSCRNDHPQHTACLTQRTWCLQRPCQAAPEACQPASAGAVLTIEDVGAIPGLLRALPDAQVQRMQRALAAAQPMFRYRLWQIDRRFGKS